MNEVPRQTIARSRLEPNSNAGSPINFNNLNTLNQEISKTEDHNKSIHTVLRSYYDLEEALILRKQKINQKMMLLRKSSVS